MKVMCSGNKGAKLWFGQGACGGVGGVACLRTRTDSNQGAQTGLPDCRKSCRGGEGRGLTASCGLETSVSQRPYQANQTSVAQ